MAADFDAFESNFPPVEDLNPSSNSPGQRQANFVDEEAAQLAARERELLGDDAGVFHGSANAIPSIQPTQPNPGMPNAALGSAGSLASSGKGFPALISNNQLEDVETDAIRAWKEKFEKEVQQRDAAEAKKHQDMVDKAKADIDGFYEDYNLKKEKAHALNRNADNAFKNTNADKVYKNLWEGACARMDTSGKKKDVKDTARMRKLILELKNDAKAPGNVAKA